MTAVSLKTRFTASWTSLNWGGKTLATCCDCDVRVDCGGDACCARGLSEQPAVAKQFARIKIRNIKRWRRKIQLFSRCSPTSGAYIIKVLSLRLRSNRSE